MSISSYVDLYGDVQTAALVLIYGGTVPASCAIPNNFPQSTAPVVLPPMPTPYGQLRHRSSEQMLPMVISTARSSARSSPTPVHFQYKEVHKSSCHACFADGIGSVRDHRR